MDSNQNIYSGLLDGIEWIWFDLDDTLYDFAESSHIGLSRIYCEYGLDSYFSTVDHWIDVYHHFNAIQWGLYNKGLTDQHSLRYHRFVDPLLEGGMSQAKTDELVWELDVVYLKYLGETGLLIDGAFEAVAHLKNKGYKIGVLSNGFTGVQNAKMKSSGLDALVDCLVLSDEININKPDRRLFDYALQKANTTAAVSLMIGDNPDTDIAGAINAGWKALLFCPKQQSADFEAKLNQSKPLSNLREILNW